MTATFDSAREITCAVVGTSPVTAANDNDQDLIRNGLLKAALRHFAVHGLGAAELAQRNAEQAFFAGNRKEYRHWLDICHALDRRMAEAVLVHREVPR